MTRAKVLFGEVFTLEKTSDRFLEVTFDYGNYQWKGALPIDVQSHGFSISEDDARRAAENFLVMLTREKRAEWRESAVQQWRNHESATFKVFNALLSGEWECRVCGPVPRVNPQAAARIRDIKKCGFIVASRRKSCSVCKSVAMHDILVMGDPPKDLTKNELRKPISKRLAERIISILGRKESVFSQIRTSKELVIDHKFPSQRWSQPESDNRESMSEQEIRLKFQLLNNQTNLLKSRECDRCVAEGVRGHFMGIRWYYKGGLHWEKTKSEEGGCIGCPWHDVERWKYELSTALAKSSAGRLL